MTKLAVVIALSAILIQFQLTSSSSSSSSPSSVTALYNSYQKLESEATKLSTSIITTKEGSDLVTLYHLMNLDKLKYWVSTNDALRSRYAKLMATGRNKDLVLYYKPNETVINRQMLLLFTNQVAAPTARLALYQPVKATELTKNICSSIADRPNMVCVQSFNCMYQAMVKKMGKNITMLTTPLGIPQIYRVTANSKVIRSEFSVVTICHKQEFEQFGVFVCHSLPRTEVRLVPLVGLENGVELEAVSVCHMDTTDWSKHFQALELLHIKPGAPLCHFLSTDDLVWVNV